METSDYTSTCDKRIQQFFASVFLDEVLQNLNCNYVFSKLDLNLAFHQIELCEESRSITTLVSPKGLFRYTSKRDQLCSQVHFDGIVIYGATKKIVIEI